MAMSTLHEERSVKKGKVLMELRRLTVYVFLECPIIRGRVKVYRITGTGKFAVKVRAQAMNLQLRVDLSFVVWLFI